MDSRAGKIGPQASQLPQKRIAIANSKFHFNFFVGLARLVGIAGLAAIRQN
jgi:hypothetical protein